MLPCRAGSGKISASTWITTIGVDLRSTTRYIVAGGLRPLFGLCAANPYKSVLQSTHPNLFLLSTTLDIRSNTTTRCCACFPSRSSVTFNGRPCGLLVRVAQYLPRSPTLHRTITAAHHVHRHCLRLRCLPCGRRKSRLLSHSARKKPSSLT